MAWTDIVRCWRTTDGEIFTDPDKAERHQNEIDNERYLKEFEERMRPAIDEALKPIKEWAENEKKRKNGILPYFIKSEENV